jgi:hypothetical protein
LNRKRKTKLARARKIAFSLRDLLLPRVFSSIKRVLGEDLFSKRFSAQKVEGGLKIMLYNKFISPVIKNQK